MSLRQVVLDTETTGLHIHEGHRIIEIGCIELVDRKLTGNYFHKYINPEKIIEDGALAVHGITATFLEDKPRFREIASEFLDFISGAELIIHNAPFDVSFLDNELTLIQYAKVLTDFCQIIDTLQMARQLHLGQRNGLDALCKRYNVDNSKRDLHGALLDANLLAQVYLAMTGGQGSFFDANEVSTASTNRKNVRALRAHQLSVLPATEEEVATHQNYLVLLQKAAGKCVWGEVADPKSDGSNE